MKALLFLEAFNTAGKGKLIKVWGQGPAAVPLACCCRVSRD